MRKKLLYFGLIPLTIFLIITYFFLNSWVEAGLEYAGEEAIGAKVEIDNLELSLSPLGIQWSKIQVANPNDPWKNFFETGKVDFEMDFNQLLRGKYIVEVMEVSDFIVGTKRTTDGSLPKSRKKAASSKSVESFSSIAAKVMEKSVTTTPLFDIAKLKKGFNADSLVSALDMQTIKEIDSLKGKINNLSAQWSSVKGDFETSKQKLLDVEQQVAKIKTAELNNAANITNAISTVDKALTSINSIKQTITDKSSLLQTNIKTVTSLVDSVDNFVSNDFNKLKSMARLPSIKTGGIAQMLVGDEISKRLGGYLYWVDFARDNIKKYSPEPEFEKEPRMKGQDIKFPADGSYPKFWVKKVILSGGTAENSGTAFIRAAGNANNISDNQNITGLPLTISLEGTENNKRALKLEGLFDRRKDVPFDEYKASLLNVPVSEFSIGKSDFLPAKITNAVMNTNLKLSAPGNKIDAAIELTLKNIDLKFETEPKNIVEKLVRQVLAEVKEFNIKLRLWNTKDNIDMALSTNLDEIITNKISSVIGEEINKLQNELKTKFNSIVNEKISAFEKEYGAKLNNIKSQLGSYQSVIDDKLKVVENKKKELTDKLEKEKSGFIENKLKGLFKK